MTSELGGEQQNPLSMSGAWQHCPVIAGRAAAFCDLVLRSYSAQQRPALEASICTSRGSRCLQWLRAECEELGAVQVEHRFAVLCGERSEAHVGH